MFVDSAVAPLSSTIARSSPAMKRPTSRVRPDQLLDRRSAVPDDDWEMLVGNGEDAATGAAGDAVIKHARFEGSRVIRLDQYTTRLMRKIVGDLGDRRCEPDAHAALP